MPNGPNGYSETEWAGWRGKVTSMLEEGKDWMMRHEEQEFQFHARIEAHVSETKEWIARSSQHRQELAARVTEVEASSRLLDGHVQVLDRDLASIKTRLNILFGTMIPTAMAVLGWFFMQILEHFQQP